jgi:hypothetical protein
MLDIIQCRQHHTTCPVHDIRVACQHSLHMDLAKAKLGKVAVI